MIHLIGKNLKDRLYFDLEKYSGTIKTSTLDDFLKWKEGRFLIFGDTETVSLDPHEPNSLKLRQFGDKNNQFLFFDKLPEDIFNDNRVAFHNAVFDINMLKQDGIVFNNVYDTMVTEMVLDTGKYSAEFLRETNHNTLKNIAFRRLERVISKEEQQSDWSSSLTIDQVLYAASDVSDLHLVYEDQIQDVVEENLLECAALENEYVMSVADMVYNGVFLDFVDWKIAEMNSRKKHSNLEFVIDNLLKEEAPLTYQSNIRPDINQIRISFFTGKERNLTINYNSPLQVSGILKEIDKLPVTKSGKTTTSIKELGKIWDKTPFIENYIEYKHLSKLISSYSDNWKTSVSPNTHRIHCSINQILETGRTATYKPNLYQMPRLSSYRNCIKAQRENFCIVGADYSSQEGRIMAEFAQDKNYIDFFNNGDGDAHSFVATTMFSTKYTVPLKVSKDYILIRDTGRDHSFWLKESQLAGRYDLVTEFGDGLIYIDLSEKNEWRQSGKILNFFLSFGGSAHTLHKELGIPKAEAQDLINSFFRAFPSLKIYFEKSANFATSNGYILTNSIIRRKRWFGDDYIDYRQAKDFVERSKVELGQRFWEERKIEGSHINKTNSVAFKLEGEIGRAGQNTPVQGTAADMTKYAVCLIRRRFIDMDIKPLRDADAMLILVPHDEIQIEAKNDISRKVATIIEDCMEEAGSLFMTSINMRPKAEINEFWTK